MKHFLVELTYTAPLERIDQVVGDHRNFLQKWYDVGTFLYSGPQEPRTGGIILARAESREKLESILAQDPYKLQGCAMYRVVEFTPVKSQEFMKSWISG